MKISFFLQSLCVVCFRIFAQLLSIMLMFKCYSNNTTVTINISVNINDEVL